MVLKGRKGKYQHFQHHLNLVYNALLLIVHHLSFVMSSVPCIPHVVTAMARSLVPEWLLSLVSCMHTTSTIEREVRNNQCNANTQIGFQKIVTSNPYGHREATRIAGVESSLGPKSVEQKAAWLAEMKSLFGINIEVALNPQDQHDTGVRFAFFEPINNVNSTSSSVTVTTTGSSPSSKLTTGKSTQIRESTNQWRVVGGLAFILAAFVGTRIVTSPSTINNNSAGLIKTS
jgi:hypothetical protein